MNIRKKTGGRIAGTPNRITAQVRSMLVCVLEEEIDNLPELLQQVSPAARLAAVLKLAELLTPASVHWDRYITHDWDNYVSFIPEQQDHTQASGSVAQV